MSKILPFSVQRIRALAHEHPTPFYVYDEQAIRATARTLAGAFAWAPDYRNFFAVKALPNPAIMQLLKEEGMGFDASSLAELELCARIGVKGKDIMFTSNNTPIQEFQRAIALGAVVNLDDIRHLGYIEQHGVQLPDTLSFRYNPGALRKSEGNTIIGNPVEAKYGLTRAQLFDAYALAQQKGVRTFGLHTMVVSNELRVAALLETAETLFALAIELHKKLAIKLAFINLGGGFGIPYLPDQAPLKIDELSAKMRQLYQRMIVDNGLAGLRIMTENGRYVTGPHGYLVSTVRHLKSTHKEYVGLDASMADLMRPGMYGAYHHLTVLGKEHEPTDYVYDVTGSLCENNDKFAIDRPLPEIAVGDIVAIHDAGAHGHAMGFNYNGKLRPAEFLLKPDGSMQMIRRAETLKDYFATLV